MWSKFLLALTFAGATCVHGARGGQGPVVDVGYACYRGNLTFPDSVAYLGIPYAEPPLGDRRFRVPLPLNTTRIQSSAGGEIVDATQYPEFCVQGSTGQGDAGGAGSEDCLKVNVYAPLNATQNSSLPVLVYIHGGGYRFGNPRAWPFDHWIHQDQHVVVVSVYYRLDSFGFLATPPFSDSGNGDFNAGFLDQRQALNGFKGTYRPLAAIPSRSRSTGRVPVEARLNCTSSPTKDKSSCSPGRSLKALTGGSYPYPRSRSHSSTTLLLPLDVLQAQWETSWRVFALLPSVPLLVHKTMLPGNAGAYNRFRPVLDGKIFTEHPTQAVLGGAFRQVPLIIGATSNEGLPLDVDLQALLKLLYPALTNATLTKFESVYNVSDFSNGAERNLVATGESALIYARNILGQEWARKGNAAFTYRYNQPNPTSGSGSLVQHAAENWMMFLGTNTGFNGTNGFTGLNPTETAFAEELIAYWLSFVRSGDPNTFKLARSPEWKRYERGGRAAGRDDEV